MPIYYALVAKDEENTILTDYTQYSGNFQRVAADLMTKITRNSMKTFETEDYSFHYINEEGISVLCMTDQKYNRKQAFSFLQEIKKALTNKYSTRDLERAKTNQLMTFKADISEKMVSSLLHSCKTDPVVFVGFL